MLTSKGSAHLQEEDAEGAQQLLLVKVPFKSDAARMARMAWIQNMQERMQRVNDRLAALCCSDVVACM